MKDKKWGEIFNNAMFLGMISAFLGYVFCDVGLIVKGDTSGLIPVCVMAVSSVVMAVCGLMATKLTLQASLYAIDLYQHITIAYELFGTRASEDNL